MFCRPWKTGLIGPDIVIEKGKFDDASRQLRTKIGRSPRYASMNFTALNAHGTLENRMHQGTLSSRKIIKWAMLNSNILEFAKNSSLTKMLENRQTVDLFTIERYTS